MIINFLLFEKPFKKLEFSNLSYMSVKFTKQ